MIGEYGIDYLRNKLLSQPGADRKQVEKEYREAKARLGDAERAGMAWDIRAGIAPLREQYERAHHAERRAIMRIARTTPTTPAGAAAMLDYTRRDLIDGEDPWQLIALKTVVGALTQMNAEAA